MECFVFTLRGRAPFYDAVLCYCNDDDSLHGMAGKGPSENLMKISIVTISFNQAEFLERCILSVLEQDYDDIEYIVVDPGSTDGSREIIEKYRDKIRKVIFEPDNGPADGLNKGFAHATGEIYAYLNSDDILYPGAVTQFARAFRKSHADVISGNTNLIDVDGRCLATRYSHRFNPRAYIYYGCVLLQQSTFFRAFAFYKTQGFNIENPISWDGELWFDMALAGARFGRISGVYSGFRLHEGSITMSDWPRNLEEQVRRRLALRLGISGDEYAKKLRVARRWYWFANRITDPVVTSQRLFEAVR